MCAEQNKRHRCNYIGCLNVLDSTETEYCFIHSKSLLATQKNIQKSEMKELLTEIACNQKDEILFSKMFDILSSETLPCKITHSDLKKSILCETLNEIPRLIDEESTQPLPLLETRYSSKKIRSLKKSTKKRKKEKQTRTQTRRFIYEKNGETLTIEDETKETKMSTEKFHSLTVFKTEEEIEEYVQQTTQIYESKLNEYAQNKAVVGIALEKWIDELYKTKCEKNLKFSTIEELITNSDLDLDDKYDVVYCRLIDEMLQSEIQQTPLPSLQKIIKYTMQTFADKNLKVFHCHFGTRQHSLIVSVPEILMRSIPVYANTIHAFFLVKFIPFKCSFMKHRRNLELAYESGDETTKSEILDTMLLESDNSYFDDRFPEIDPNVCVIKKIMKQ